MTIDREAKQDLEPWTTFAEPRDIPEWITKAYVETYRGPHNDEPMAPGPPRPVPSTSPSPPRS